MERKRCLKVHRSNPTCTAVFALLLAACTALGCSQGAVPNFASDDEEIGNVATGDSVEITFALIEPDTDELLSLTETDLIEVKVRVSTNGETEALNSLNVIWCAQDSTATAARRLCLNDDLTCLSLEGTTDEDQSREATLFGSASELRSAETTDLSFTTTIRARLLEDNELTENPCSVIGSTDLKVDVEVLVDAVGPTTRVEHKEALCPTVQSALHAAIPGKQKVGEQEKPIAPGASYIIEWFAIPAGETDPVLIQTGQLDWTDAEYLCKPIDVQEDPSYYADNPACLLKALSHQSMRKGAVIFVTARPEIGGTSNPFHQSVELCNALPDCQAGEVPGELTFVSVGADGTEREITGEVAEGVEAHAKCKFRCYDGDPTDQITVRLNLTEDADAPRSDFLATELLLPTLPDPVLGYATMEHIFPLDGLVDVGDDLFCQAYPFPEPGQQPGGDDDPYCCGDECDEQDTCYVSDGIVVGNTPPQFNLSIGPSEKPSKSSDFSCTIKGLTDPDEGDIVYKVDMRWENSDGDVIFEFEPTDYNRLNFEAFEQVMNPITENIEDSFKKQDTLCCIASVVENKFNTGFEAEENKVEESLCFDIVNSPAVYVPGSVGTALKARAIPLKDSTPPCTDQAPLEVDFDFETGKEYEFYGWQSLQCQINGVLYDPDTSDSPVSEVEFYDCNSNEVLYAKKGTDVAPPGQFLPFTKTDICCRIAACDGEDCSPFISQNFSNGEGAAKVKDSPTLVSDAILTPESSGENGGLEIVTGFNCSVEAYDCDIATPVESVYVFSKAATAIDPSNISYVWTREPEQAPPIQSQEAFLSISEANLGCSSGISCQGEGQQGKDFETETGKAATVQYPSNLAPTDGTITISSDDDSVTTLSTLECSFEGISDPEGKLDEIELRWLINGETVADEVEVFEAVDGETLSGTSFLQLNVDDSSCEGEKLAKPGDKVQCSIVAKDTCGTEAEFESPQPTTIKKLSNEGRIQVDATAEDLLVLDPPEGGQGKEVTYSCGLNLNSTGIEFCSEEDIENYEVKVTFSSDDPAIGVFEKTIDFSGEQVQFQFSDVTADGCLGESEELTCEIQIFEGDELLTLTGELKSTVEVSDPPNDFSVTVNPEEFRVNDTLKCMIDLSEGGDGEIGISTYQWKLNNGVFIEGEKTDTLFLAEGEYTAGDTVQCFAVVDDGCHPTNEKSSPPLAVQNTAPTLESATLTPGTILAGDEITCTAIGYADVDIAAENLAPDYTFTWEADDGDGLFSPLITVGCVEGPGFTNPDSQVLSLTSCPDLIGVGQSIRCVIQPRDMNSPVLTGEAVTSNNVSLGNSPPSFTFVKIKPTGLLNTAPSFDAGQSEVFCDSELVDPDGTEGYNFAYTWTVTYPSGAEFIFETENEDTLDIATALAGENQQETGCLEVKCAVAAFAPNEVVVSQFQESDPLAFHRGGSLRFGASQAGVATNPITIGSTVSDGDNPPDEELSTGTIELIYFPVELPQGTEHQTLLAGTTVDDEEWELRIVGTGQVAIAKADGIKGTSVQPLSTDDWNFISLRWDSNSTVVQLNGQKQAISTAVSLVVTSLEIGASSNGPNGFLDEMRISKVAFDPAQDQAILKNSSNTVALYHFNLNETVIPADSSSNQFHGQLPFLNPPVASEHSIANTCNDPLCVDVALCVTPPQVSISLAEPVEPGETTQTVFCEAAGAIDLNAGPLGSHNFQVLDPSNGNAVLGEATGAGGSAAIEVTVTGCRQLQCRAVPISGFLVGTSPGFSTTEQSCPPTTNTLVDFGCDDGESCSDDISSGNVCNHNPKTGQLCDSVGCLEGEQATCSENAVCSCESICDQAEAGPCQVVVFDANEPDLCKVIHAGTGTPCTSENPCVPEGETGSCDGGFCILGQGVDDYCDDGNPCTINLCADSGCVTSFSTEPCDDENACTVNDTCDLGACTSDEDLPCDDGNQCTLDACDVDVGCVYDTLDGEPCNDGDACTQEDECVGSACIPQGTNIDCDDGKQCTDDSCNAVGGCVNQKKPKNTPCDDGDVCTLGDACNAAGNCKKGAQDLNCDDDNTCTVDQCDPIAGCFQLVANVNTPCDDGDACTTPDLCDAQGECQLDFINCDDGENCTADSCKAATGCEYEANTGLVCDDGNECTESDLCNSSGVCISGPTLVCDDNNVCTTDFCDPAVGCDSEPAAASPCDDGDACTALDLCFNGSCTGQNPIECSDSNPCTQDDSCNSVTGNCDFPPVVGLVACDDGNACTEQDQCSGLSCQGTVALNCDDADACTTDSCDSAQGCQHAFITCGDDNECTSDICAPATGCVFTPTVGTVCDDGNPCTFNDVCANGVCGSGNESDCDDGNSCTQDFCDVADGVCTHVISIGFSCSDGDLCTEGTTCEADGSCGNPSPVDCEDGNVCTTTPCDSEIGCIAVPAAGPCEDGNFCTSGDTCVNGICAGGDLVLCDDDADDCFTKTCDPTSGCPITAEQSPAGAPCSDGDICTEQDACPGGGAECLGTPVLCDDDNPCTDDSCLLSVGCVFTVNNASCDDDTVCTINDTCSLGICSGTAKDCDDGNACTSNECSEATDCTTTFKNGDSCNDGDACTTGDVCGGGNCVGPGILTCDDGNPCTGDICSPATGCQHPPNTDPCNDGDSCTSQDTCSGGVCLGTSGIDCPDDGNPCTATVCDAIAGCGHENDNQAPCDDGNACGAPDFCDAGVCKNGPAVICPDDGFSCTTSKCFPATGCDVLLDDGACDDNNVCTADSCVANVGCTFTPISESAPCDDGDVCTIGEKCISGQCAGGAAASCDDGVACTADTCDAITGCTHTATDALCDDNLDCTADSCDATNDCSNVPNNSQCDDGVGCTTDTCDIAAGCLNTPSNSQCDDAISCTNDTCNAVNDCVHTADNSLCDDGVSCTNDVCDDITGCSNNPDDQACDDNIDCTTDTCEANGCLNAANNAACDDGEFCTVDICSTDSGCINDNSLADGDACDDGDACTENDSCNGGACAGETLTCCTPPPPPQVCGSQELSLFAALNSSVVACAGNGTVNSGTANTCAYDEGGNAELEVCVQQDSGGAHYLFNDSSNAPVGDECIAELSSGTCLNIADLFGTGSSLVVAGFGNNLSDAGRVHFRCNFNPDCNGTGVASLPIGGALKCTNDADWTENLSSYVVGGTIFGGQNAEHVFRVDGLSNTDDAAVWARGETLNGASATDETDNLVILGAFAGPGEGCTDASVLSSVFKQSSNPLLIAQNDWNNGGGSPGDSLCVYVEVINLSGNADQAVDLYISAGISGN